MSATPVIPADLTKEIRALLPLWVGCVTIVWSGGLAAPFWFRTGFLAYLLGSAALGALSIGHEYTNRTLPLLLSAPISRQRMFAVKASVLIPMLVILATIAIVRLPAAPAGRELKDTALVGTLALLSSAFLAPWLTMVCRNVIAGAVFTLSIPAVLLIGSELAAMWVYGLALVDTPTAVQFRMHVLWSEMTVVAAVGAVASWRTFARLEPLEGSQSELRLPRWLRRDVRAPSAASQPSQPIACLLRKELHLQKMVFVVSPLYICGWAATVGIHRLVRTDIEDPLLILTVVHGLVVALLSGSLASAEERHFGVHESQMLMPVSSTRQWVIKGAVVYGVCVSLAMTLPVVLVLVSPINETIRANAPYMIVILVAATVSLYVSSLSSSGVKALLLSGPATICLGVGMQLIGDAVFWFGRETGALTSRRDPLDLLPAGALAMLVLAVVVLLLRFGLTNHRSTDRSASRIWRQILWMSAATALGFVMLAVMFGGRL